MNKGKGIGIAVVVIAVAVVVGIASLPDEVLLDSPVVDTSVTEDMNIPIPVIEELEETEPEETIPEETEPEETEEEGKVIEVKIKDGIGSGDK